MRLTILALPLLVALTACGTVSQQALDDGTHEVTYTFNPMADRSDSPQAVLPERAAELCPGGWRKLSERRQGTVAEGGTVTWHITCV